ncbi:hypothetical protein Ciccas_004545 [Cichlidogyrus casuarinus]|uniref:Uncharacterized protein n=1 Tax=Cichlidogyrus casuarinus TaxID=1844966 RepID=A0ABD2QBB7_9PLAT
MYQCNCQAMPPFTHMDGCPRCQKLHETANNQVPGSPNSWMCSQFPGTMNYTNVPLPNEFSTMQQPQQTPPVFGRNVPGVSKPQNQAQTNTNLNCPILRQQFMQNEMSRGNFTPQMNMPNMMGTTSWAQPGWYGMPGLQQPFGQAAPWGTFRMPNGQLVRDLSDSWTQTPGDPTFKPMMTPAMSSPRGFGKPF